jgi:hypothetical protein
MPQSLMGLLNQAHDARVACDIEGDHGLFWVESLALAAEWLPAFDLEQILR